MLPRYDRRAAIIALICLIVNLLVVERRAEQLAGVSGG